MSSKRPRRMRKCKKVFVLGGLFFTVILAWFLYLVFSGTMFLYRSEEKIGEKLLIKTPVGTSLEEVREFLEEMDWTVFRERNVDETVRVRGEKRETYKGDYLLEVIIGEYQGIPWGVGVIVGWVFESGLLTEIRVDKEYDAL